MEIKDVENLLDYHSSIRVSDHALREAHKESLHARDIFYAILNGKIIEHYRDRKRLLIVGPIRKQDLKLHVICSYNNDDAEIAIVTVYIPDRPKWLNELVRAT